MYCRDSKRHSVGRRHPENNKKERERTHGCDKSHMCLDHPRCATPTKVGWRLGVVVSVVGRTNEVNQYRARLVHDG